MHYQILGSLLNGNDRKHHDQPYKDKEKTATSKTKNDYAMLLQKYFRLNVILNDYYKKWADQDQIFKSACQQFYGIRILDQEPVENLFSFICSQNNHISR